MTGIKATGKARKLLGDALAAGATWGLNLFGVIDAAAYDADAPAGHRLRDVWPGVRSALVVGSAGPLFWERFRARVAREPALGQRADPLDAHTVDAVAPVVALFHEQGITTRAVFPFHGARDHALSFPQLALRAGFGVDSVLGLVLHPEYGPWLATRAALLTDAALPASVPLAGFDPCTNCPAPCVAACPGGAFPERRWSHAICLDAKRRLDPCRASCAARIHCVFGVAHRYPDDAIAYHCALPEARRLPSGQGGGG